MLPWRDIPIGAESNELLNYFMEKRIRYIMWETCGYAVKSPEYLRKREREEFIYLMDTLRNLSKMTKVVYQDACVLVLDIHHLNSNAAK